MAVTICSCRGVLQRDTERQCTSSSRVIRTKEMWHNDALYRRQSGQGSASCRASFGDETQTYGSLTFWSIQKHMGRSGVVTFRDVRTTSKKQQSRYQTLKEQIGAAGVSGIASYGLFNTLYYFFAYLAVLFSLPKPATATTSLPSALTHVCTLLALVWAGSQVTKIPRAVCALACAPLMDRLLRWIRDVASLQNTRQAFLYVLVPMCWLLFFVLVGVSILFLMVMP